MAKVNIKSEKFTAFGGILFVLDRFDRILSSVIDSHLGLRSKLIGYQYSEIIRAIFSVYCYTKQNANWNELKVELATSIYENVARKSFFICISPADTGNTLPCHSGHPQPPVHLPRAG